MYLQYETTDELQHYGVKGMKWGVRRDVELLANNRRNREVRKARKDYRSGKITNEQKKTAISKANAKKKSYMAKVKKDYESAGSKENREKMDMSIRQEASKVSTRTAVKGAKAINKIFTTYNIASTAAVVAAGAIAAPEVAAVYGVSMAGYTIGQLGSKYITDRIIDKLS